MADSPDQTPATGAAATAAHLAGLLRDDPDCRARWQQRIERRDPNRDSDIHHAAVCRVLADHLAATGRTVPARTLKDRVGRALTGTRLSAETLDWFIDAFGLRPGDAEHLHHLLDGAHPAVFLRGDWTSAPEIDLSPARQLDIVWRHELHHVGADRRPARHRSLLVVAATTDGVNRYPCYHDANAATLRVLRGGTPGPTWKITDDVYRTDITLPRPLNTGQTASIEYVIDFDYHTDPAPELRLAVPHRVEHVEIDLRFHPDQLPAAISWGHWPALDAPPVHVEPVTLDTEHAAHRYVKLVETTIVGFTWTWP